MPRARKEDRSVIGNFAARIVRDNANRILAILSTRVPGISFPRHAAHQACDGTETGCRKNPKIFGGTGRAATVRAYGHEFVVTTPLQP